MTRFLQIPLFTLIFTTLLLFGCSEQRGYPIGNVLWQIEFPENYRANLTTSDTLQVNTVCGIEIPGEMIQLFEFQQADAKDSLPVPNACTAFIAKRDFLRAASLSDCALEIEHMYAYIFSMSNVNYDGKRKDVKIDGQSFIEIENVIHTSTGQVTHGDMHYVGEVNGYIVHIQMSYRDENEKRQMEVAVRNSKFVK